MSPVNLNLEKARNEIEYVAVEPAINAFNSLVLIASAEEGDPGLHEWVSKTRAKMTQEELFRHKLVTLGLHYSILPTLAFNSFEAYMAHLEATPASEFREVLLKAYSDPETCITEDCRKAKNKTVNWDEVLASAKNYVDFLKYRFGEEKVDEEIEKRAYEYVIDPVALKQLTTSHIRWFWKNHLKAEWQRVAPTLEQTAKAFNKLDFTKMTRLEILQSITGKETIEMKWEEELESATELVFIPNPHIGPYLHSKKAGNLFYITFGAHMPEGSDVRAPELDRAEIVSKLSALADETRLQILQMISQSGEMRATELMEATQLSQPSISRYLSQLTANGFLQERRANGAKIYALNYERIEKTLKAISAFLLEPTKEL